MRNGFHQVRSAVLTRNSSRRRKLRRILIVCEGCKKGDNRRYNGIYCRIKDWKTNKTLRFVDVVMGGK